MKCLYSTMNKILFIFLAYAIVYQSYGFTPDSTDTSDQLTVQKEQPASGLSFDLGMELVSRYVWRGVECGVMDDQKSTPHIQPAASLTYNFTEASNVTLGLWGSYGFDGSFAENDFYFSYGQNTSIGDFSLTLTDYYYPSANLEFNNMDADGNGAHTVDAQLGFTFPDAFPLRLLFSSNVYNDVPDYKSFYVEASYPFTISEVELNVFAGAAQGQSMWHAVTTDKFEFVNVGFNASKSIKVSEEFSIPIGVSWILNAHLKKTYIVFKVGI